MSTCAQHERPHVPASQREAETQASPCLVSPAEDLNAGFVYDLRCNGGKSRQFYSDVAAFSDRVLAEIERRASPALDGYYRYVSEVLAEAPRSRGEYALELLTLGMILQLYGDLVSSTPHSIVLLARKLFALRRRSPRIKPVADFLRAGIFELFLRRKPWLRPLEIPAAQSGYAFLPVLIEWLQATGEFEQEWRRIDNWRRYWGELPAPDADRSVGLSISVFDWFMGEAEIALGKYTQGVVPFLQNAYSRRFWREDQLFCGRLPVEYYLGMVAAEVMNQGLREEFLRRPRKVLLVPACLRGAHASTCKAVTRGLDISCAGCNPHCSVNRITCALRQKGVQVFMVPHSSGFSRWLERWQADPAIGVGAVACIMNILAGGYEMRARGIASQCVPLDFPACRKHWESKLLATGVNEERLVQIVTARL